MRNGKNGYVKWLIIGNDHVARLRALGNAVVPQQVRKAFEILMGIKKREDILSPLPIIFTDSR